MGIDVTVIGPGSNLLANLGVPTITAGPPTESVSVELPAINAGVTPGILDALVVRNLSVALDCISATSVPGAAIGAAERNISASLEALSLSGSIAALAAAVIRNIRTALRSLSNKSELNLLAPSVGVTLALEGLEAEMTQRGLKAFAHDTSKAPDIEFPTRLGQLFSFDAAEQQFLFNATTLSEFEVPDEQQ